MFEDLNILYGYLAIAFVFGYILGAILFSYAGEKKIKDKVKRWASSNLDDEQEKELLSFIGKKQRRRLWS